MRCGKAESDLATCESRLASSNETLHRMETEMKTLRESERSAREGREELVRRLKRVGFVFLVEFFHGGVKETD